MKLSKFDSFFVFVDLWSSNFFVWCRCFNSWLDLFLGINAVKQMEIFRILAGILHLGNIELKEDENSSECTIIPVRIKQEHPSFSFGRFVVHFFQVMFFRWRC